MAQSADRLDPRLPVVIGVGQLNQRVDRGEPPLEPIDMIAESARRAATDAKAATDVLAAIDSIRIVSILSWRYRDPGTLVAARIGAAPRTTWYSGVGGNTPQALVNRAALDISAGDTDMVLIGGAEAWRTRSALRAEAAKPDWTSEDAAAAPTYVYGSDDLMVAPEESARGVVMPVQVYPMFESAWRAANGWSMDEHRERMGALWARFSKVAASNPNAWIQQEFTAEQIVTPGPDNRMIGFPYTKKLNSNNAVEQSAALLMCSAERAQALGVPSERWVFIHAGTDAHDTPQVSNRRDLHSSPAIRTAGRRAFELAGINGDDLAHIDLYSCFPSAVEIAAHELGVGSGIGDDRPLTVTGGLSFAGGPWSNYVSHSIATMVERLRDHPGDLGLCSANGGFLTKHAFGIYSTTPPSRPFRHDQPQTEVDAVASVEVAGTTEGSVTIEAYTVMHDRDGEPEAGFAAVRSADGRRAWGRVTDAATMAVMCSDELVGREAELSAAGDLAVG